MKNVLFLPIWTNLIFFVFWTKRFHSGPECSVRWKLTSNFFFRNICLTLAANQPYYKYILIATGLAVSLEFPRFFEIRLDDNTNRTVYWTTNLMENTLYVQMNSYWNDIFATGLVPLAFLCFMNMRIFMKIQVKFFYLI